MECEVGWLPETIGSSGQGGSGTRGRGLWSEPGRVSVPSLNKQLEMMFRQLHSLEFPELLVLPGEREEQGRLGPSSDKLLH